MNYLYFSGKYLFPMLFSCSGCCFRVRYFDLIPINIFHSNLPSVCFIFKFGLNLSLLYEGPCNCWDPVSFPKP